jgi:hypothetical protein
MAAASSVTLEGVDAPAKLGAALRPRVPDFGVSLSTEAVDKSVDGSPAQRAFSLPDCIFITLVKK